MAEDYKPPVLRDVHAYLAYMPDRDGLALFLRSRQGGRLLTYRLTEIETEDFTPLAPLAWLPSIADASAFLGELQKAFGRGGVWLTPHEGEIKRLEAHLADMRSLALPKP